MAARVIRATAEDAFVFIGETGHADEVQVSADVDVATAALGAPSEAVSVSVAANGAVISTVPPVSAPAGHAGVWASANGPTPVATINVGDAGVTETAYDAAVIAAPHVDAPAAAATASATANAPTVVIRSTSGEVLATVATQDAFAALLSAVEAVAASSAAYGATVRAGAAADQVAASVAAYIADIVSSGDIFAEHVSATASASDPTVAINRDVPRHRTYVI